MRNLLLSLLMTCVVSVSYGQNAIPTIEFTDTPYLWDKTTNEVVMCAKEAAEMKGGMKMSYKFKGAESPLKYSAPNSYSLVMDSTNPTLLTGMRIYRLQSKGKGRQVSVVSAGIGKARMNDENVQDFNSKKLKDSIYELVLTKPLTQGEYVFTNGMNFYTFSIQE